jgi:hypothetical protein
MTTTKMEAWTLLDKESQLYIAEDNKDAWNGLYYIKYGTLSDEGSRLYALLHEARIRRELIL